MFDEDGRIPVCPECGEKFDNIFDSIDHLLEDDETFDPVYILPGGLKLMLGSLLRLIYENRRRPALVSQLVQDCYSTLAMSEFMPEHLPVVVRDIIVDDAMENLDDELKNLFKNGE
jgi:hypothetical protein